MPTLYVSEPASTLRLMAGALAVTTAGADEKGDGAHSALLITVEPHLLESIVIIGHNHITADALHFALDHGITISWISRGGRLKGRAVPEMPRSADLRLAQYAACADDSIRLYKARSIVRTKIINSRQTLEDIRSNDTGEDTLSSAIGRLGEMQELAAESPDIENLTGLEGAAAREYFSAYGSAFRSEITFNGRNRRPPKDPANAILSFAYTLLGNMTGALLEARGLDPCLGFFHEIRSGRHSLALDLLEEFRSPVVDRFVLRSCNLRIIRPEMFQQDQQTGAVLLTDDGRKSFFMAWEKHLLKPMRCAGLEERLTPRQIIRRQVDEYAASLRQNRPYTPFLYGG